MTHTQVEESDSKSMQANAKGLRKFRGPQLSADAGAMKQASSAQRGYFYRGKPLRLDIRERFLSLQKYPIRDL